MSCPIVGTCPLPARGPYLYVHQRNGAIFDKYAIIVSATQPYRYAHKPAVASRSGETAAGGNAVTMSAAADRPIRPRDDHTAQAIPAPGVRLCLRLAIAVIWRLYRMTAADSCASAATIASRLPNRNPAAPKTTAPFQRTIIQRSSFNG